MTEGHAQYNLFRNATEFEDASLPRRRIDRELLISLGMNRNARHYDQSGAFDDDDDELSDVEEQIDDNKSQDILDSLANLLPDGEEFTSKRMSTSDWNEFPSNFQGNDHNEPDDSDGGTATLSEFEANLELATNMYLTDVLSEPLPWKVSSDDDGVMDCSNNDSDAILTTTFSSISINDNFFNQPQHDVLPQTNAGSEEQQPQTSSGDDAMQLEDGNQHSARNKPFHPPTTRQKQGNYTVSSYSYYYYHTTISLFILLLMY